MKNDNNKENDKVSNSASSRTNKELPKLDKRGRVAGLVISFVAMIALVGAFTFTQYPEDTSEDVAELEDEVQEATPLEIEAEDVNVDNDDIANEEVQEQVNDIEILEDSDVASIDESTDGEDVAMSEDVIDDTTVTTNVSVEEQIAFSEYATMLWPIEGETIMWYSMGQAIYFETLNQYKLNDAMVIAGEVGMEVLAGEIGVVESIVQDAQTGTTITMDMGNGYSAVYGQLTDVRVTEGSLVEQGQIIGTLAEPTKYYSLEGCNLYFQVLKDGEAVDPFIYLE